MKQTNPLNILCAGECMVELRGESSRFTSSFAGDVINFGIYLKRLQPDASVKFFSAIGEDTISQNLLNFLNLERIDSEYVFRTPDKTLGLYMVHTNSQGERTFNYWRSDSAAKQMFTLADTSMLNRAAMTADYFFFSGITLAILDQHSRNQLFTLAENMHAAGKTIVFDPNYRPTLWENTHQAKHQITCAYQLSDILLSSQDDEQALFGTNNIDESLEHLEAFNISEIILTNGPGNISGRVDDERLNIPPVSPEKVVDTTSAGDSFNAGYLAARHAGSHASSAVLQASALASTVIGCSGAIIPKSTKMKGIN